MKRTGVIEVDTRGMRAIALERGLGPLAAELVSNAFDEKPVVVRAALRYQSHGKAFLSVEDDSPDGFRDLTESYVLFADSYKRNNPEQRGRFNAGEKFVLAACDNASISSTTGTYHFNDSGRQHFRIKRSAGTLFEGTISTNKKEIEQAVDFLERIIPPAGVEYYVNDQRVYTPEPVATIEAQLPTMVEGEDKVMRPTRRYTTLRLYSAANSEGWIYELGIPVVRTGDAFSVDVQQKVPLTVSRDNVPPSYLALIRSLTLNAAVEANELETNDTTSEWVRSAMGNENTTNEAIRKVMDLRFGTKRVSADPSDPEANNRAVAAGYTVIHGRMLSSEEWALARRASSVKPASQVTPSNQIKFGDGPPEKEIMPEDYTDGMRRIVEYAKLIGCELLGQEIRIRIINEPIRRARSLAYYGGGSLTFNLGRLGRAWFEHPMKPGKRDEVNELLIHEFGHHYEENHLLDKYHDALCDLGARMTRFAVRSPEFFR